MQAFIRYPASLAKGSVPILRYTGDRVDARPLLLTFEDEYRRLTLEVHLSWEAAESLLQQLAYGPWGDRPGTPISEETRQACASRARVGVRLHPANITEPSDGDDDAPGDDAPSDVVNITGGLTSHYHVSCNACEWAFDTDVHTLALERWRAHRRTHADGARARVSEVPSGPRPA